MSSIILSEEERKRRREEGNRGREGTKREYFKGKGMVISESSKWLSIAELKNMYKNLEEDK